LRLIDWKVIEDELKKKLGTEEEPVETVPFGELTKEL
jgi:hypothetical protein